VATAEIIKPAQRLKGFAALDQVCDRLLGISREKQRVDTYRCGIKRVFRRLHELGVACIEDVNAATVNRFQRLLRREKPDAPDRWYAEELRWFKTVCNKCTELEIISRRVEFPPIPPPKSFPRVNPIRRLSAKQIGALLGHLQAGAGTWEGKRLYCLVVTVLFTGLRKDEAVKLRVVDVRFDERLIHVRRRDNSPRSNVRDWTPMADRLALVLRGWTLETGCEWLFPGKKRRTPWTGGGSGHCISPLEQLRAAGECVGISGLTLEMLRQYFKDNAAPQAPAGLEQSVLPVNGGRAVEFIEGKTDRAVVLDEDRNTVSKKLSPSQYRCLRALCDRWPNAVSHQQMSATCPGGWWKVLYSMKKSDSDWNYAILFPDKRRPEHGERGYRIRTVV